MDQDSHLVMSETEQETNYPGWDWSDRLASNGDD